MAKSKKKIEGLKKHKEQQRQKKMLRKQRKNVSLPSAYRKNVFNRRVRIAFSLIHDLIYFSTWSCTFWASSLRKSQNQAIAVRAVASSGIAIPVQGKIPLNVPHQMYTDVNGRSSDMLLIHLRLGNLSQERPMNHIANGKVTKKPTDTM
jgi:hypothetical protein